MLTEFDRSQFAIHGEVGLPEYYPTPKNIDKLLFYIQRNLNMNTVVYTLNDNRDGFVDDSYPMQVFWIKYTDGGIKQQLNTIQKRAFGYSSKKINNDTFEFRMESYLKMRFFIAHMEDESYSVITKINGQDARLHNIYVFANEFGIFPKVEYIELFGYNLSNDFPSYQKILI